MRPVPEPEPRSNGNLLALTKEKKIVPRIIYLYFDMFSTLGNKIIVRSKTLILLYFIGESFEMDGVEAWRWTTLYGICGVRIKTALAMGCDGKTLCRRDFRNQKKIIRFALRKHSSSAVLYLSGFKKKIIIIITDFIFYWFSKIRNLKLENVRGSIPDIK